MKSSEGVTEYIIVKRCLNCWHTNEVEKKRCGQCDYLLIAEASEQSKQQAIERINKLKEKAKEDE